MILSIATKLRILSDKSNEVNDIDTSIKLENLKLSHDSNNSAYMKDLFNENNFFNEVYYNESNNSIKLKTFLSKNNILLYINFYAKNENINDYTYKINNDYYFNYVLSNILLKYKVNHILIPLLNIDIDFTSNLQYFNKIINKNIANINRALKYNKIIPICSICIKEFKKDTVLFDSYINDPNNNNIMWKHIIFQLLYCFFLFNKELEYFNYNNDIYKNLYIRQKTKNHKLKYTNFKNKEKPFIIKQCLISIKISNFKYSYCKCHNNTTNKNHHLPINDFFKKIISIKNIDSNTNTFLNKYINADIDITKILYDTYFGDFLQNNKNGGGDTSIENIRIMPNLNISKNTDILLEKALVNTDKNQHNAIKGTAIENVYSEKQQYK